MTGCLMGTMRIMVFLLLCLIYFHVCLALKKNSTHEMLLILLLLSRQFFYVSFFVCVCFLLYVVLEETGQTDRSVQSCECQLSFTFVAADEVTTPNVRLLRSLLLLPLWS